MSDASAASAGLREIERQRMALAAKVRLPWWYLGLFALAMLVLIGLPLVNRFTPWQVANWALLWPALIVVLLSNQLLGYATGAKLTRGTLWAYPSSRLAGLSMLAVAVIGMIGVYWLLRMDQPIEALVLTVVCTVAALRCLVWQTEGIRKDIRTGRALAS